MLSEEVNKEIFFKEKSKTRLEIKERKCKNIFYLL